MKKLIFILLIFLPFLVKSQNGISGAVINQIKLGNAIGLSIYLDDFIELNVPGNGEDCSKQQAVLILKNFFSKNPPKTFSVIHQGKSENESEFYICKYNEYRCYFLIAKSGNVYCVQQLEFEIE